LFLTFLAENLLLKPSQIPGYSPTLKIADFGIADLNGTKDNINENNMSTGELTGKI